MSRTNYFSEPRPQFSNNIIESNRSKPPRRLTASIRCLQMIVVFVGSDALPYRATALKALGVVHVLVTLTSKAGKVLCECVCLSMIRTSLVHN